MATVTTATLINVDAEKEKKTPPPAEMPTSPPRAQPVQVSSHRNSKSFHFDRLDIHPLESALQIAHL